MAIGEQVDRELRRWLVGGSSAWSVRLGTTTLTAEGTSLRPVQLAERLQLAGSINYLKVSTKTLAAASRVLVGALVGAAASPPLRAEARGVSLRIGPRPCPGAAWAGPEARAEGGGGCQLAAGEALGRVGQLTVDVQDVAVELLLGGRRVLARVGAVLAEPLPQGRALAKWAVKHGEITLELDGRAIGRAGAGTTEVVLADALRRVDVSLRSDVDAGVDAAELLAILDVVAALVAAAAAEASGGGGGPRALGVPWGLVFRRASARLQLDRPSGDPLLEVSCERGSVSDVPGSKTEVHAETVQVRQGGAPAVSSCRVSVQGTQQGGASVRHWFPVEGGGGGRALPWTGCLDLLAEDPRFAEHKAWLQRARDVAVVGKRPLLEAGGSPAAERKRSRL